MHNPPDSDEPCKLKHPCFYCQETPNPKTVRLIGLGPSAVEAPQKTDGVEVWGIQYCWENFKLNRAFVMDDEEWIIAKNHSFENIKDVEEDMRKAGIPIYVSKKWANVPNTVEYPIEEIKAKFPHYFMDSFAYMFALAIHEGFERIELYGIDFRYFNELGELIWRPEAGSPWADFVKKHPDWNFETFMMKQHNWLDETHCGAFWVGLAIGKGIEVVTSQRSSLMKPLHPKGVKLYGYEVSPLIEEQRKDILSRKKKEIGKTIRVGIHRPQPGEDKAEFLKRVKMGLVPPIDYGDAKEII